MKDLPGIYSYLLDLSNAFTAAVCSFMSVLNVQGNAVNVIQGFKAKPLNNNHKPTLVVEGRSFSLILRLLTIDFRLSVNE